MLVAWDLALSLINSFKTAFFPMQSMLSEGFSVFSDNLNVTFLTLGMTWISNS